MKIYIYLIILFILPVYSVAQNLDCVDAQVICEGSVINYMALGPGVLEIIDSDCIATEIQPDWFYFEFNDLTPEGSLLEFTIVSDPGVDFDFSLWGPNNDGNPMDCDNLGPTISCSHDLTTTGLTGLSDTESGWDWEPAIPVSPGDGFWLIVDNITAGPWGFSIEWGPETAPYLDCDIIPNCETEIEISESILFCPGTDINLIPIVTGEIGSVSYEWTSVPTNGADYLDDPTNINPVFNAPEGETGPFTFTIAVTDDICTISSEIELISYESILPSFDLSFEFCETDDIVSLPTTSNNGYTGVWSPSDFDPSGGSTNLMFSLDAGQDNCVESIDILPIVHLLANPTFGFSTTYCAFDDVFVLPTLSDNGISGVWLPTEIDPENMATGLSDIIFTPNSDACASASIIEIEVLEGVIAIFDPLEDLCSGDPVFVLPTNSINGIVGDWDIPSIDPATAASITTVTFTPNNVLYPCQETYVTTINTLSDINSTFDLELDLCDTDLTIVLPTSSMEAYTGAWDISIIDPLGLGGTQITTIFTPDVNQADCLIPTVVVFTIVETIIPSFDLPSELCELHNVFVFPTISENAIAGSWDPSTINPEGLGGTSITAEFTPITGFCYAPISHTIDILDALTVSFDLPTVLCESDPILVFPSISIEGYSGNWTLDEINPSGMGEQSIINTFTVDAALNECYESYEIEVNIVSSIIPMFNNISICENDAPLSLPTTSDNGLDGSWEPAVVDPFGLGGTTVEIIFSPENSGCASNLILDLMVEESMVPAFTINTNLCTTGGILDLPNMDDNGIIGSWDPTFIDPSMGIGIEVAVFTPDPSICAAAISLEFNIEEGDTPIFVLETAFCTSDDSYDLPNSAVNGVVGVWNIDPIVPATLGAGTHSLIFTPDDPCYSTFMETITITSSSIAIFDLNSHLCTNDEIYSLPLISINGLTGTWNIPSIDPSIVGTGEIELVFTLDDVCAELYETSIYIINVPIIEDLIGIAPSNCGVVDGSITIEALGNNLLYSIDEGNNWSIDDIFTDLAGGVYNILVSNGACTSTQSISLTSPGAPMLDTIIIGALSSCSIFDGQIEIMASGNDLEYSINGGLDFFDDHVFIDLPSGNYTIIIRSKSAPDCTTAQVIVLEAIPPTMIIDSQVIPVTDCGAVTGQVIINATGELLEYSINSGANWQQSNTFSNLEIGDYSILVQSQTYSDCTDELEVTITGPELSIISNLDIDNPSFCTGSDGSIAIIDHYLGLEYSIDNGTSWQIDSVFIDMPAGNYNLLYRLINATNCVDTLNMALVDPDIPEIIEVVLTPDTLCLSGIGSILVMSDGLNHEYSIDSGLNWQSDHLFENLEMGDYDILVRSIDAPSCVNMVEVMIDGIAAPVIDSIIVQEISDCGLLDGGIQINTVDNVDYSVDGGLSWSTLGIFNNLGPGVYDIIIRTIGTSDCTSMYSLELIDPGCGCANLIINKTVSDISCFSMSDGYVELLSIDGGADHLINWSNGQTGFSIDGLDAGWYYYTIQYDENCEWLDSVSIQEPTEIQFLLESISTDCSGMNNGSINISELSGGVGAILYAINEGAYQDSPLFIDLASGVHGIVVQDENGCVVEDYITVEEGESLTFDFESIASIHSGDSVYLNPLIDETELDSFYWSPNENIQNLGDYIALVTPNQTTDFTLTVYKEACAQEQTITVEVDNKSIVILPTIFMPGSSDGNNYFYPSAAYNDALNIDFMRIYDRWGGEIFTSEQFRPNIPEDGWDGTMHGIQVDPGVYIYMIQYTINGISKDLYGDITVVR